MTWRRRIVCVKSGSIALVLDYLLRNKICVTCMYSLNYQDSVCFAIYTTVEFHGCTLFGVLRKIR